MCRSRRGRNAGGAPFRFNSLTKVIFNPEVFGPSGNSAVADAAGHGSGVFGRAAGRTSVTFTFPEAGTYTYLCAIYQVTFTKPGTYHYFCPVHCVDMSGDIVVMG